MVRSGCPLLPITHTRTATNTRIILVPYRQSPSQNNPLPMPSRRAFLASSSASLFAQNPPAWDVIVYGATPAGIAAALSASRSARVLLIEPTARLGGMVTSGLSHTDFRTFESLSGHYLAFSQRVLAHYRNTYGPSSPQARDCFRGTSAEPKVNLAIFEQMLAEKSNITVRKNAPLADVAAPGTSLLRIRLEGDSAAISAPISARIFVDATYEGDLMAAAGVPFRVGREARSEYNESLAPLQADQQLQGYNFRLIATREPANRVYPTQPAGYRREDFVQVLALLNDGRLKGIFGYPNDFIYKAQIPQLPNGKYDINDVSNCAVRLSLPGENLGWPTGDAHTRARIFAQHLLWNTGLLWFLQNDPAVPARWREEARQWGWCRDEFPETQHLPPQLYVREARRMHGRRVYTEADSSHAPGDARTVLHPDAIAMGDYGNNCHGTAHTGPRIGGKHTGEFYRRVAPYQIPYGILLAPNLDNLLVPGAVSASHVGFCALRLEPIWMSLGQAAGAAAALSLETQTPLSVLNTSSLQRRLWREGSATTYFSDIPPSHPDFFRLQAFASLGAFHGLHPTPADANLRGKNIEGQYFEA
ncbi:MAG: FAD-dependent oxidoreductase, partial [Bryobacter sp.]|nr:FAD-dependent oxidoreductase [Bryobacter sp.]